MQEGVVLDRAKIPSNTVWNLLTEASRIRLWRSNEVWRSRCSVASLRPLDWKPVCSVHFSLKPLGTSEAPTHVNRKLILECRMPREEKVLRNFLYLLVFAQESCVDSSSLICIGNGWGLGMRGRLFWVSMLQKIKQLDLWERFDLLTKSSSTLMQTQIKIQKFPNNFLRYLQDLRRT